MEDVPVGICCTALPSRDVMVAGGMTGGTTGGDSRRMRFGNSFTLRKEGRVW